MTKTQEPKTMEELVNEAGASLIPFKQGDVSEVIITSVSKNRMLVDLQGLCLGIIPEREYSFDSNELKPGDKVLAYILSIENDDGHAILSLRRADKERLWRTLEEKSTTSELLTVKITQANRGGLIAQYGDIEGFLPVSQLSSSHYPRVTGGDKDKILDKLNDLVNQNLRVKIISFDRNANKLIFSEKAAGDSLHDEIISQFEVNQKLKGKVTGIVDFGLFVNIGEIEGLVHISEISWDRVEDPHKLHKIGDEVEVMVIGTEGGRVSLSIKRLIPDPWNSEISRLKVGSNVEAEVTRVTPFGVFVKITDRLEGIVHLEEISDEKVNPQDIVQEGKKYKFLILSIEEAGRKITLSLKQAKEVKEEKEAKQVKSTANKELKEKKSKKKKE